MPANYWKQHIAINAFNITIIESITTNLVLIKR
jgi:hypothetical protein